MTQFANISNTINATYRDSVAATRSACSSIRCARPRRVSRCKMTMEHHRSGWTSSRRRSTQCPSECAKFTFRGTFAYHSLYLSLSLALSLSRSAESNRNWMSWAHCTLGTFCVPHSMISATTSARLRYSVRLSPSSLPAPTGTYSVCVPAWAWAANWSSASRPMRLSAPCCSCRT